ncbi:MAG: hypothetical protein AAGA06_09355 [Pseudomonadota bacterium]
MIEGILPVLAAATLAVCLVPALFATLVMRQAFRHQVQFLWIYLVNAILGLVALAGKLTFDFGAWVSMFDVATGVTDMLAYHAALLAAYVVFIREPESGRILIFPWLTIVALKVVIILAARSASFYLGLWPFT